MFGKVLPYEVCGILLLVMGGLTMTHQVQVGTFAPVDQKARQQYSEKIGNKIFIPAVLVAVVALILSRVKLGELALPEMCIRDRYLWCQ